MESNKLKVIQQIENRRESVNLVCMWGTLASTNWIFYYTKQSRISRFCNNFMIRYLVVMQVSRTVISTKTTLTSFHLQQTLRWFITPSSISYSIFILSFFFHSFDVTLWLYVLNFNPAHVCYFTTGFRWSWLKAWFVQSDTFCCFWVISINKSCREAVECSFQTTALACTKKLRKCRSFQYPTSMLWSQRLPKLLAQGC